MKGLKRDTENHGRQKEKLTKEKTDKGVKTGEIICDWTRGEERRIETEFVACG